MRAVCPLGWSRRLRVSPLSGERDFCPPCLSVTSRALLSEREMSPPEEPLGREKVQVTDSRFSCERRTGTQGSRSRAWRKGRDAGHTGAAVGLSLQDVGLQGAAPHHLARTFSSCIAGCRPPTPYPGPSTPGACNTLNNKTALHRYKRALYTGAEQPFFHTVPVPTGKGPSGLLSPFLSLGLK